MNKQRWYCYFLILIMILSIVSSVFVQHPNVRADANPPTVTINFAGNLTDSGGPYWRPHGESDILDEAAEGVFADGYYTNDSRQSEGWMYINLTVVDTDGVDNVWLNWLNETTWTNYTYQFTNEPGDWWTLNTSNNFSTAEGYDYSFDIVANDTVPNSITVEWNKTGIGGNYVRRYVQLNCTPVNITYTPYYLYNATYITPNKNDRLHHDQGVDGTVYDSGYLLDDAPTSTINKVYCSAYVGFHFDESVCNEEFDIVNIYYHFWWSADNDALSLVGWQNYSRANNIGTDTDNYVTNAAANRSSIYYNNGQGSYSNDYFLDTRLFTVTDSNFTDNNIYETYVVFQSNGASHHPSVINNESYRSFILYNVPSNESLNTSYPDSDSDSLSDWNELYVTYTDPFSDDTDNDGINDYWEVFVGTDPNNCSDWNETILPVVTTNVTTGIGEQNATLHGYLDDDGNGTCRVGFQWGTTTSYGRTDFDLPFVSGGNPPSGDYEGFQFPKDIWNYNSSVESDSTCENWCTQGQIYDTVSTIFRYNSTSDDWDSWVKGRDPMFNDLTYMTNSTDAPQERYWITLDSPDTLSFTYDNLTATTNDEYGHQIGIIGGLHLYGLSPGTLYHYRAFATNDNGTAYGSDMSFTTLHNWTTSLNCFNASDGSAITDWDVFVTNQSGSHVYTSLNNNNPHGINLSDGTCPTGTNIAFMFSKDGYTNRTYYYDISITGNYTINAYLSPINLSHLYTLIVTDEYDYPIEDVKISIREYINETLGYKNISIVFSDAAGSIQVRLVPDILHKILLVKDGYDDGEEDYIPDPEYYGIYYPKYFRMYHTITPVEETYTFWDLINFNATMYSNNSILVMYEDTDVNTINAQFYSYENFNFSTGLKATNTTTSNTFSFWITGINISREHEIIICLNHTTLGYEVQSIIVLPFYTPQYTDIEAKIRGVWGDWEFSYEQIFFVYLPCIVVLVIFGKSHPGIGIIGSGLWLGFIGFYLSIPNELVALAIFIIAIGFIYILVKKGRAEL